MNTTSGRPGRKPARRGFPAAISRRSWWRAKLARKPAALIAHQPAWGLDPGATRFVLEQVLALRAAGAAIVYFSSELEEVLDISDRIAVMANGGFAGIITRAEADIKMIGLWMSGRAA